MREDILSFLKMKAQKKLGRLLSKDEQDKLYTIASMHEAELREALIGEIDEFVSLVQKCMQCNSETIETDGLCHICRICKQNEIADYKEFKKLYNDNYAVSSEEDIVKCYKEQVEVNGGIK